MKAIIVYYYLSSFL